MQFFSKQQLGRYYYMGAPHGHWLSISYGEKAWRQLHNDASCIEQVLEAPPKKNSSCTATYNPSRKPSKLDEPDMRDTTGEVRMNS